MKIDKATYQYNEFNQTTKVETFDGNVQINRYDAEGLRYEMLENDKLVQFIFNENREVIAEQNEEKWTSYIRGSELIARTTDHARTYYHYASDEMGSITHIVDGKNVLNEYQYDAWGEVVSSKETVENRFKFNGQQLDPITQQYYLRARFYAPAIARFTQEDTYRGDGLNLYAYCDNNPVFYVDPSGYFKQYSDCCQDEQKRYRDALGKNTTNDDKINAYAALLNKQVDALTTNEKNEAEEFYEKLTRTERLDLEKHNRKCLYSRAIPGQAGVITGGDSTKLFKNIMYAKGLSHKIGRNNHQAHHIIPSELKNHKILQKIGMDLDDYTNGILLPTHKFGYGVISTHQGYHSAYNQFVREQLDNIDINSHIDDIINEVFELQMDLIELIKKGTPLYYSKGANNDTWKNALINIRK